MRESLGALTGNPGPDAASPLTFVRRRLSYVFDFSRPMPK